MTQPTPRPWTADSQDFALPQSPPGGGRKKGSIPESQVPSPKSPPPGSRPPAPGSRPPAPGLRPLAPGPWPLAPLLCWLLILLFAVFFSVLAVQGHRTFQTNGLDLGNVDQALWNTAHGRFLHFTLMAPVQSRLALHVEPILLLAVPFYWLGLGRPELLLVLQAVVVALGAWPLYQLAAARVEFRAEGLPKLIGNCPLTIDHLYFLFPLAYLLLPALESAVLFDFHAVTLAPTFLLFAFLALERDRPGRFFVFSALAMACKEDMPLVVMMLGLYAGLARGRWRLAGLTLALSAAWFILAVGLVQPRFAGGNIQLDRYAWLGDSPVEMLGTLLTRPGLVWDHLWQQMGLGHYLFRLFFPTAFLALLSPLTLLPMLPPLAVNLLSANPFTWRLEDFHYGAPLAPFLFISALYGLSWLQKMLSAARVTGGHAATRRVLSTFFPLLLLVCSLVYHYYRGYTPLARPFAWPAVTAHHERLAEVIGSVPDGIPLFAQPNLAPHLSGRPIIYDNFDYFTDPAFPAAAPVAEVLLDVSTLANTGGLHEFLRRTLLESGDYELLAAQDGILRLRRLPPGTDGAGPITLPDDFYTFAQPDSSPAYDLPINFGDIARLHGFSLHFNREEEVEVSIDLALLRPAGTPLRPVLYLLDAAGQPLGATVDLQPALAWFPPETWPPGQVVRVRFNTLPWPGYTRQGRPYRLALGLVQGADPWAGPRYQPIVSGPTPLAPRLAAEGNLVELAVITPAWGLPAGGPLPRLYTLPRPAHPLRADFDGQVRLLGYDSPRLSAGQPATLTVTLAWQAITAPPAVTRFVQLVGPDGQIYGQNDSAPDNGRYPTGSWLPGEVVVETVALRLQPGRPAGPYRLHLGFYQPASGRRLGLPAGQDHVEIPVEE